MQELIAKTEARYAKPRVVDVKSGDTVRVHQRIEEGGKTRVQVFEGLVIRTDRKNSLTSRITVRRIASGVGVEKSFLLHSPLVEKVEVTKRSRVRRNYLSYMRNRSGKSARLSGVGFDKEAVNLTTIEQERDQALAETAGAAETKADANSNQTDDKAANSSNQPEEASKKSDQAKEAAS